MNFTCENIEIERYHKKEKKRKKERKRKEGRKELERRNIGREGGKKERKFHEKFIH